CTRRGLPARRKKKGEPTRFALKCRLSGLLNRRALWLIAFWQAGKVRIGTIDQVIGRKRDVTTAATVPAAATGAAAATAAGGALGTYVDGRAGAGDPADVLAVGAHGN